MNSTVDRIANQISLKTTRTKLASMLDMSRDTLRSRLQGVGIYHNRKFTPKDIDIIREKIEINEF